MIRVSRMADYGVVVLSHIAREPARLHTAAGISGDSQLPLPTVSKLLKQLAHSGVLESHRGAKGGYSLSRTPGEITVAQIIGAVDGPIALADCLDGHEGVCGLESFCPMRGPWGRVSDAIRGALEGVTLADMTAENAVAAPARAFESTADNAA